MIYVNIYIFVRNESQHDSLQASSPLVQTIERAILGMRTVDPAETAPPVYKLIYLPTDPEHQKLRITSFPTLVFIDPLRNRALAKLDGNLTQSKITQTLDFLYSLTFDQGKNEYITRGGSSWSPTSAIIPVHGTGSNPFGLLNLKLPPWLYLLGAGLAGYNASKTRNKNFQLLYAGAATFSLLQYQKTQQAPAVGKLPFVRREYLKRDLQCPPLDAQGQRRIDPEGIRLLDQCVANSPQTKALHSTRKGNYTLRRKKMHREILNYFKKELPCIPPGEQPIAILTGGPPGAGKTTWIRNNLEWIASGNLYHIDADEVRAKLPEYDGWNASNTHLETKDLVNALIHEISVPCKFDVLYDGTMNKVRSYKPLIRHLRRYGYKIFVIYIKVPYEVSLERAMGRYQRSGRYVPKFVIDEVFENGLAPFEEIATQMADGYIMVDGVTQQVIRRGGMPIPENRPYSQNINGR